MWPEAGGVHPLPFWSTSHIVRSKEIDPLTQISHASDTVSSGDGESLMFSDHKVSSSMTTLSYSSALTTKHFMIYCPLAHISVTAFIAVF